MSNIFFIILTIYYFNYLNTRLHKFARIVYGPLCCLSFDLPDSDYPFGIFTLFLYNYFLGPVLTQSQQ